MGKSIRSKIKKRLRTVKRQRVDAMLVTPREEEKHDKLMKVAQGKQLTLLRPKNAFKYPDSDDAVFPQHEVMKPVDFRAQNLPMAGTVFRGNRRKYSNEEKEMLILTQHIRDIIGFYQPRAVDPSGGFFQSFYIDGRKFNPEFRQIVSSSRMVINFMLAGKLLQDPKLLDIGRHGLEYIEKVHYNPAKQSYAFTVRNHKPEDMVEQAYGYAFILAAHAAARAAGVAKDNVEVGRVFDLLERKFWLPDKGAYLDTISAEGVVDNSYRGQNSNMHMCEALIAAYEATKETRYLDRAEVLAETFAAKLAAKGGGFVWEHYDVNFEIDWEYNKNDPTNIYRPWGFQPGHQIEWAKNLLNIYRHRPKFWMVNRAKELFDGAWELSWDDCHGGLVYGFGPDRKWCDSEKYFWVQGESIATASLLYQATKDPKYIEKYVCLWQYCWKHWVDHEHGGWLCFKMSRSNERTNDEKAIAGGKCDYHTLVSCVEALRPFQ